jgi:hypothetical protein
MRKENKTKEAQVSLPSVIINTIQLLLLFVAREICGRAK